jgi:uncharacterized protein with PIN domain
MRWLCDEMLVRLARLLRAAGHDTALAHAGQRDEDLLAMALAEERILLTRDRRLAAAAGDQGLLLTTDRPLDQARELGRLRPIDWRLAPFTRCVVDNAPLRPATGEEFAAMPGKVRALPGPFNACPACGRLYWPGSHVKRMLEKLESLSSPGGRGIDGAQGRRG